VAHKAPDGRSTDGAPTGQEPAPGPPERVRPRWRWAVWVTIGMAVLAGVLVGLDRVAAAYAQNRVARAIQSQGFPSKPDVTVEGFPFLTQLISRNLQGVEVRSAGLREGPVTVSVHVNATQIRLNPGYSSGTIGQVNGTGLIAFSSIASAARAAGAPGLAVSAAGPRELKIRADLGFTTVTVIASISRVSNRALDVHVISADGVPVALLGPLSNFTVPLPRLPLGLTIQRVAVSAQGVVIHIAGSNVSFSQ
jgi:LmeA-like phospholipid-binding